jgi:hypothetical protein
MVGLMLMLDGNEEDGVWLEEKVSWCRWKYEGEMKSENRSLALQRKRYEVKRPS